MRKVVKRADLIVLRSGVSEAKARASVKTVVASVSPSIKVVKRVMCPLAVACSAAQAACSASVPVGAASRKLVKVVRLVWRSARVVSFKA